MTLYQQILGEQFQALHPALRSFLGDARGGRASGPFRVTWAAGRVRGLFAALLGLPPAGEYDLLLEVLPEGNGQRWIRHFGKHTLVTLQSARKGLLLEASGPASLAFELSVGEGGLFFTPRGATLFGIPCPPWLAPRVAAENWPTEAGGWKVHVRFCLPVVGEIGAYEGEVTPTNSTPGRQTET